MDWGRQHPESELEICTLIKAAYQKKFGVAWRQGDYDFEVDIQIVDDDSTVNATCYVTKDGIQKSATDRSCPFFQLGKPNKCTLWGRDQWPDACRNTPYFTAESTIVAWEVNHGHECGYYWTDVLWQYELVKIQ